eukprot:SAG11_NODE_193_length_12862_cov_7.128888_13_plen_35_part_00
MWQVLLSLWGVAFLSYVRTIDKLAHKLHFLCYYV